MTASSLVLMSRYHDAWNRHDVAGVMACFAEHASNHGRQIGRAGLEATIADVLSMFPDLHLEVVEIVCSADRVVVRNRMSGTHRVTGSSPVYGGYLAGAAATGARFDVQHTHWMRVEDGLIVDHHSNRDDLGMMVQLGLLPLVPVRLQA